MNKNLTYLSILLAIGLCALPWNKAEAQCIPAAPATVAGVADVNVNNTFSFPNVPTGQVIELVANSAADAFTFELCNNSAAGWADGTDDTNITILDANAATATALTNIDDGCTNGAGPNFWGPTNGIFTPPGAGTYYAYLAEWDWAAGYPNNDPCFGTDGSNSYTINVTIDAPPPCDAGVLDASDSPVDLCPGEVYTVLNDGSGTAAGGFGLYFSPQATGTGALGGAFILSGVTYPADVDNDLGGLLSGNGFPQFSGQWAVYSAAYSDPANTFGSICSFSQDSIIINFLADTDPGCTPIACDAGVLDVSQSPVDLCPGETFDVVNDGSGSAAGGFGLFFSPQATGTGALGDAFILSGVTYPATIDNDLGGLLSGNAFPPFEGQWAVYSAAYSDAANTFGSICSLSADSLIVNFLTDADPACAPPCTAPVATAIYDCASNSIVVDVTDAGVATMGSAGFLIDINGTTQTIGAAGQYTFPGLTPDQTYNIFISDGTTASCDVGLGVFPACANPSCGAPTEGLTDGDFEGAPGTAWTETSVDLAGTATGFAIVDATLPLSGLQSAWFGGFGTGSVTTLEQSITIPMNSASALLTFWALEAGGCAADDVFTVSIDGTPVWTQDGTNANCNSNNWHQYTVDLSAFDDGMAHMLSLSYSQPGTNGNSNLFVDLASLEICPCPTLTLTPSSMDETCMDGSGTASVTTSGGTGSYTYAWSNGMSGASVTGLSAGTYTVTATDSANGCTGITSVTVGNMTSTSALTVMASATGENCGSADGTATVTNTTGGSGNYSYAWSNGMSGASIMGLTAGTYTVTATDNMTGCSGMTTVTVSSVGGPNAAGSFTDASCNGGMDGTATATATGGTAPYTYAWSNGGTTATISGLAAGTYTCTVTDAVGACPFVVNVMVGEPSMIMIMADAVVNSTCNGSDDGSISISVSGGTPPYSYAWSNGDMAEDISGLAPGDYIGTITDANGCEMVSSAITVTEPDAIGIIPDAISMISCNGASDGAISITVTGGTPPYSYAWSNGSNVEDQMNLAPGAYSGTITDANGCTFEAGPVTLSEPDAISVTVDEVLGSSAANDGSISITVSGGTAPYTYSWSDGSTGEDPTGLAPGEYSGTITDANGCTFEAGPVTVWDAVGVEDVEEITSFLLSPNPTRGNLNISMTLANSHDVEITVFDLTGRTLISQGEYQTVQANFNLDMSDFADGIYMVRVLVDGKSFFTERVVKAD